jgi:hypothetical protein
MPCKCTERVREAGMTGSGLLDKGGSCGADGSVPTGLLERDGGQPIILRQGFWWLGVSGTINFGAVRWSSGLTYDHAIKGS